MKKLVLLLLMLILVVPVYAYDVTDGMYYDSEEVSGMFVTKERAGNITSITPSVLKRKSDNTYVYCIQSFMAINMNVSYEGYYELNDKFSISEYDAERIRLLAYFGYNYPGHEAIKWYGVTQYLIWKTADKDMDIYFTDAKFGKRIDAYQKEIEEIEKLILDYYALLKIDKIRFIFHSLEELEELRNSNIFLSDIVFADHQVIKIPKNTKVKEREIFFFHQASQDFYVAGPIDIDGISLEMEMRREIKIIKWYGDGKYEKEEGAEFEIYQEDKLVATIVTDANGEVTISLPYGSYRVVQIKGISGYRFVEPFELLIGTFRSSDTFELFDEPEKFKVPSTGINESIEAWFMYPISWLFMRREYVN